METCNICSEETVMRKPFGILSLCDKCREELEKRFQNKNKTKWELGGADPYEETKI